MIKNLVRQIKEGSIEGTAIKHNYVDMHFKKDR